VSSPRKIALDGWLIFYIQNAISKITFASVPKITRRPLMMTLLDTPLRLPIIGSPMFIVSGPELVLAQCKAGIVGSFPALNARPANELRRWLHHITDELHIYRQANPDKLVAPFAVNQIVHPSNDRLEHDVDLCAEFQVPLIITSLHAPSGVVEKVHAYGGKVLHDVTTLRHAKKALEAGVDGLILVCNGAGGHAGRLNPFAFVAEVRRFFDGPLVLAGAMSRGEHVLSACAAGADLVYMGTRFIATHEANASLDYKNMVIKAGAGEIIFTDLFSGVHGNYLRESIAAMGLNPDDLPNGNKDSMRYGSSGSSKSKAWRDIWSAGQGVAGIHDCPSTQQLVATMEEEYRRAHERLPLPPL
jgi:nitronate monooxygenase